MLRALYVRRISGAHKHVVIGLKLNAKVAAGQMRRRGYMHDDGGDDDGDADDDDDGGDDDEDEVKMERLYHSCE